MDLIKIDKAWAREEIMTRLIKIVEADRSSRLALAVRDIIQANNPGMQLRNKATVTDVTWPN